MPRDFPKLLLHEPPSTGKTIIVHKITSTNKLELNASGERGTNVIRDNIKSHASTITKFKTISTDESENLTDDEQHCLRRVSEVSKSTHFFYY